MEASRRIELLYTDLQSARFCLILNGFLCNKLAEHTRNISRMCGTEQAHSSFKTANPFKPLPKRHFNSKDREERRVATPEFCEFLTIAKAQTQQRLTSHFHLEIQ